jgi:hypothetical protein
MSDADVITQPLTLGELWLYVDERAQVGHHAYLIAAARAEHQEAMLADLQWRVLADVAERLRTSIEGARIACPAGCNGGLINGATDVQHAAPEQLCSTCRARGFLLIDGLFSRLRGSMDAVAELPSTTEQLSAAIVAEILDMGPPSTQEGS